MISDLIIKYIYRIGRYFLRIKQRFSWNYGYYNNLKKYLLFIDDFLGL